MKQYGVGEKTETDVWIRIESSEIDPHRDFCGGPVVKTPHFHFRGHELKDWWGGGAVVRTRIPHASQCGQKKKKEIDLYTSSTAN